MIYHVVVGGAVKVCRVYTHERARRSWVLRLLLPMIIIIIILNNLVSRTNSNRVDHSHAIGLCRTATLKSGRNTPSFRALQQTPVVRGLRSREFKTEISRGPFTLSPGLIRLTRASPFAPLERDRRHSNFRALSTCYINRGKNVLRETEVKT